MAQKKVFWKVSVYDFILDGYVVKACSFPSKAKANTEAKKWKSLGYDVRVSTHLPQ